MGQKHSKQTTPPIQPPVGNTPADTTQAAGAESHTDTAPTSNVSHNIEFKYSHSKLDTAAYVGLRQNTNINGESFFSQYRANYSDAKFGAQDVRKLNFTRKLLSAVAYGMESKAVNVNPQPKDVFAEDLLKKSPEFLLERGDITDWGGRTFKNITAFEYALWAKDFKMLEMMLACIPATAEGDRIRAGLLEQYEQVTAPINTGGGLTYELTYDRPVQDAKGIPIKDAAGVWQTTSLTKVHTENHFDVTPLLKAYQDYNDKFNDEGRTWPLRNACWVKIIGTLQRLLPIHILQRYCDPDTPFAPTPSFTGVFKRTTQIFNDKQRRSESLLSSSLSTDFSLYRDEAERVAIMAQSCGPSHPRYTTCERDSAAVRLVDEVSSYQIGTKIRPLLVIPTQGHTQFCP